MDIDFGKTAHDYGRYRAGFPDELFTRLAAFGIGVAGQRLLDLGTGAGTLGRGFARRGCVVTGLDPSEPLLEQAKQLDREAGVSTYTHEAWRGRIRASAGVAASLSPEKVTRFDAELEQLLRERFPTDPLAVHHRAFALVCQSPER